MIAGLLHPTILRFDSIPSTNTEAVRQAMQGSPEGLVIVAREQTAGRGRQRRRWASPIDAGLYVSIVLRPHLEIGSWPLVTLMASLAGRDAILEACQLGVDLKWPNDLLVSDRKLGGILAEAVESQAGRACVVGIGINLRAHVLPPELSAVATSIETETGIEPNREMLFHALMESIARRYDVLQASDGTARTVSEWAAYSSYATGKPVHVEIVQESFEGITCGLEPDGALRVATRANGIRIVRAGDVTALRHASATK